MKKWESNNWVNKMCTEIMGITEQNMKKGANDASNKISKQKYRSKRVPESQSE